MKKFISAAIVLCLLACCLAGCGDKSIDGTETVILNNSESPVVTEKDGGLSRNEKGEVFVVVTQPDGSVLEDENGNPATTAVEIEAAITTGRVVDYSAFSITLPNDWTPGASYQEINLYSEDETNHIVIYTDKKSAEKEEMPAEALFGMIIQAQPDCSVTTDEITVAGVAATRTHVAFNSFEDTKVLNYYSFSNDTWNYGVLCYSADENVKDSEFEDILNLMVLY